MQGGDVGEADERLGVVRDGVEVEVRNRLRRAVAALQRLDDVHLGVGEERVQVGGAVFGVPRRRSRRGHTGEARA
jgi:hypothetical protein